MTVKVECERNETTILFTFSFLYFTIWLQITNSYCFCARSGSGATYVKQTIFAKRKTKTNAHTHKKHCSDTRDPVSGASINKEFFVTIGKKEVGEVKTSNNEQRREREMEREQPSNRCNTTWILLYNTPVSAQIMHNTKHSNFLWSNFILFICFFHSFYLEVSFVDSIEHSAVSIRIWPKATANSIAHHLIQLISYFISHSQVFPDQIKIRPNWSFMKSSSTLSLLVAMGIIFRSFATLRRAILNNNYVCDQKSKNLSTTFSWNHLFLCEYNVPLNQIVDIKKFLMQAIGKIPEKISWWTRWLVLCS